MSDNFDDIIEKRKKSISDKYRISIIDEEDLKEVKSLRVSPLNIYILISSLLVLFSIALIALIFLSPIRRWVPGYGNVYESFEFRALNDKVSEVEEALLVQESYNESLRKILMGNVSGDFKIDQNKNLSKVIDVKTGKIGVILPEDIGDNKSTKILGSLFFVTPVSGTISSGYLDADLHYGVDILAAKNTPVKSILDGIIIFSDWTMEAGNTLCVQHPNNIISVYKHNSSLLKKSGERISAGEAIAIIGDSGTLSNGPHLHFELWYDGYPVDPEKYINF